jgi:hypothetical protein
MPHGARQQRAAKDYYSRDSAEFTLDVKTCEDGGRRFGCLRLPPAQKDHIFTEDAELGKLT